MTAVSGPSAGPCVQGGWDEGRTEKARRQQGGLCPFYLGAGFNACTRLPDQQPCLFAYSPNAVQKPHLAVVERRRRQRHGLAPRDAQLVVVERQSVHRLERLLGVGARLFV